MTRALLALYLVPALASLLFGPLAVMALAVLLAVTTLFALPLFFAFRRLGWLRWWQVVLGTQACALPVVLLYLFSSHGYHATIYGPLNSLMLLALGAVLGLVFWFAGIFRNPAFPVRGT